MELTIPGEMKIEIEVDEGVLRETDDDFENLQAALRRLRTSVIGGLESLEIVEDPDNPGTFEDVFQDWGTQPRRWEQLLRITPDKTYHKINMPDEFEELEFAPHRDVRLAFVALYRKYGVRKLEVSFEPL